MKTVSVLTAGKQRIDAIRFTPSERRLVAELLQRGDSNKLIAHALGIAENTVKDAISGLLKRLALGNRTALALWCERHYDLVMGDCDFVEIPGPAEQQSLSIVRTRPKIAA